MKEVLAVGPVASEWGSFLRGEVEKAQNSYIDFIKKGQDSQTLVLIHLCVNCPKQEGVL